MTRLKTITGHRAPQSECRKQCGFREGPRAGKSTFGPTFTPARTDQTGCHSGVCGTNNSILRATLHSRPHPRLLHQVQWGLHPSQIAVFLDREVAQPSQLPPMEFKVYRLHVVWASGLTVCCSQETTSLKW